MNLLIKNATIVTMTDRDKIIPNGFIAIKDDKITYVGDTVPKDFQSDIIVDGTNKVVLPGLVNMHSHSPMVMMRGYADDLSLQDWLYKKVFPFEAKLSPDDIYWGAMYAMMEMVCSGITCFSDMYFHMNEVARAVDSTGMRACLCTGINNIGHTGPFLDNWYFIENQKLFKEWNNTSNGRISIYFGPHSVYACPREVLYQISDKAHELGTGIHIHISETERENNDCMTKYGKSPVALLDDVGMLGLNTIAAHCVHVSEEDMDILKARRVTVAYNPTSNLKLGSGIPPIKRLMQKGVNITLGTDGAASNNNLNIFEEMNLAALISKGIERDPTVVEAFEALSMSNKNAAQALGNSGNIGLVKPGMKADLTIINTDKIHQQPIYNTVSNIIYSAQASDVETVIIDGKIIMENKEFKTIDKEQVVFNLKRITQKLA